GIPAVYYGTEQGLHGSGSDAAVREAMWGGPGLDRHGVFYDAIKRLTAVRNGSAPLRYGRVYARPISGDGIHFGLSTTPQGVLASSRIVADEEVLVVANTPPGMGQTLHVIVDSTLTPDGAGMAVLYSNRPDPTPPDPLRRVVQASVAEADGGHGEGPV